MSERARPFALALLALVGLVGGAPPRWFPGAELAILPGLAALDALCRVPRGAWLVLLVGFCHLAWFSRSLWPLLGPGLFLIAALGACYPWLVRAWTRAGERLGAPGLAFACGVAATSWLRAHIPEIPYPHAQPCHAWYQWPTLLGPLRWGGEPLANLLIAWFSTALAGGFVAAERARARRVLVLVAGLWGLLVLVVPPAASTAPGAPARSRVTVFQSAHPLPGQRSGDPEVARARWRALVTATLAVAGSAVTAPPALVVWPESALPSYARGEPPALDPPLPFRLAAGTRLLCGSLLMSEPPYAIAALLDPQGRLLDWHEKQRPVPAAERLPFLDWLPPALAAPWLEFCARIVGYRPELQAGRVRPPLRSGDGVPFAALTCFDNAFDTLSRRAVADGARLLVVLSNESWYEGGAELDQMLAMSVCRALETGTPIVRSTVDGLSCAIDAEGRLLASLPRGAGAGPTRLDLDVPLGPGALSPMAWLHELVRWLVLASALVLVPLRRARVG
ncbi:MAG: apolipoprotein N-acyltransferase [Planctomycetes bacterium]|nr:apolipoprotein N-acyltransferase [Planctomycetota bacterium]